MPEIANVDRAGFQGSKTSWVAVTIYQHADDPILLLGGGSPGGVYALQGRKNMDADHSVVGVSVSQSLEGGGSFTIQLKPSQTSESIFKWLTDDDWVDIVFYEHDQPWHTMRGLIDTIQRQRTVSGTGATSTVYTITGRSFQKIWEITPVWFSPHANSELVTDAVVNQVFEALTSVLGNPVEAVKAYLRDFLEELSIREGPNWDPPSGMSGIVEGSFLQSVYFPGEGSPNYYINIPARKQFNPNHMMPQGTLWQLAQQHSDALFTELFTDLLPNGDCWGPEIQQSDPLDPDQTRMTVVVRDKPFPVVSTSNYIDPWDKVPIFNIPRQSIVTSSLARSGAERFNAYYVASLLHQESMDNAALEVMVPLIDRKDVKRHGLRRLDITSQMKPDELRYDTFSEEQRKIIRDWYALNPYLLSGNLSLGHGRPDVKVGCRARIPGTISTDQDETYYIEQVTHTWAFGPGTKTTLGVTRGWIGSDDSYLEALQKLVDRYVIPSLIRDGNGVFSA